MSGDDPDFLEFFAGEFWPLRRVGFLLTGDYPPDWRVERLKPEEGSASYRLVPPELAGAPERRRNLVYLAAGQRFWVGEDWFGTTSVDRLPGGQPYLRVDDIGDRFRRASWSVDWGRPCLTDDRRCLPRSVRVDLSTADSRLWDRYHQVVATIVGTLTQPRRTAPSTGDAGLPAPGRRGEPASRPLEMDLPIGGLPRESGSWVIGVTPMWRFIWDEWCNRGLSRATLRVLADGGASITVPGLDASPAERGLNSGCRDTCRPSTLSACP